MFLKEIQSGKAIVFPECEGVIQSTRPRLAFVLLNGAPKTPTEGLHSAFYFFDFTGMEEMKDIFKLITLLET